MARDSYRPISIPDAQAMVDRVLARRAEKKRLEKEKWDKYYEQLAKSTPFVSGGAKRVGRNRHAKPFHFNN